MREYDDCQAMLNRLMLEHRQMHEQVNLARAVLEQSPPARASELLDALARVRIELIRHFRQEEGEGCLAEALAFCPSVSSEIKEVKAEHGRLRDQLDRLIESIADSSWPLGFSKELREQFEAFAESLGDHERREDAIMAQAFGATWHAFGEN